MIRCCRMVLCTPFVVGKVKEHSLCGHAMCVDSFIMLDVWGALWKSRYERVYVPWRGV